MTEPPVPPTMEAIDQEAQAAPPEGADPVQHWRRVYVLVLFSGTMVVDVLGSLSGAFTGRNRPLEMLFVSFLFTQVGLTALWAAFGPVRLSLRIPGISLFALLLGGLMLSWGKNDARGVSAFLLVYFACVLIGALLARGIGLHVVDIARNRSPEKAAGERSEDQFSIRDMLIWTALSGGLLILLKRLAPDLTGALRGGAELAIFMVSLTVINLAATWGALGTWRPLVRWPLAVLAIVPAGILAASMVPRADRGLITFLTTMPIMAFTTMLVFRFLSYRLVWRRRWKTKK